MTGIGKATWIEASLRSSYSTSASARAVLHWTHQRTALKPNVTSPFARNSPNERAIVAW